MATNTKGAKRPAKVGKEKSRKSQIAADKRSLTEKAYEEIKRKVVAAEYTPGQFLHETDICEELGIGRTPVHQAMHLLMLEGLVEIIPRKGIVVRADTINDLFKVLEVRSVIESYCAEQAAARATDEQKQELKQVIKDAAAAISADQQDTFMELDKKLHWLITQAAANHIISELVQSLHERMSRIWYLPHWEVPDLRLTQKEHAAVVNAILSGDQESARQSMRDHISSLRRRVIAGLEAGQG